MATDSDYGALLTAYSALEKKRRWLWPIATVVFTVLSTTASVSWTLSAYVADLKHANQKLREDMLVMDKKIEALEEQQKEVRHVRETADRALLLAQLAHRVAP